MNPQIKTKWLEALRSGEYPQDTNFLRTDNGFCCMGVLCDIAHSEGIGTWKDPGESISNPTLYYTFLVKTETEKFTSLIPWTIGDWAGLDPNGALVTRLMSMNDSGYSFEQIANKIEETL